jgi:hypothetical protein
MANKKTIGMLLIAIAGYSIALGQLHRIDVTFTKWITDSPHMSGVVGGEVGAGRYSGEILKMRTIGDTTWAESFYHFHGADHNLTAHVYVTENDAPGSGTAVITGIVSEGWLKGATVSGEYKVWTTCPIPTPGNSEGTKCYQGTLHILKDRRE